MNKSFRKTDFDEVSLCYEESNEYYEILLKFLLQNPDFKAVKGLKSYNEVSGEYLVAVGNIRRFYIGRTNDLGGTILGEWLKDHPGEDIFSQCIVFIRPVEDIYKETSDVKSFIPDKFLIRDLSIAHFGGEKRMNIIKDKLNTVDKKQAMVVAGGVFAVIGVVSIVAKLFKCHKK